MGVEDSGRTGAGITVRSDQILSAAQNLQGARMRDINCRRISWRNLLVQTAVWPLVLILSACAGITVQNATKPEDDKKAGGFRYYQAKPFLFVHADGKGSLSSEVVWLPDPAKILSIHPYAVMASNSTTLKFTNGTLDEASVTVDETVVPTAVLSAIASAGVFKFIDQSQSALPATGDVPAPYLFRILYDGTTGTVVLKGDAAIYRIKATVFTGAQK
jgi:hypothetical protein